MKTKMRKTLSFFLVLILSVSALPISQLTAFALTSGDFGYAVLSEEYKTCEITDYTGSEASIVIPNVIDGYTVTGIAYRAFADCTSLTSITISDSVTSIGHSAFSDCTSLTDMAIPNSVTSIDNYAFSGCTSLKSITISDSVTSIGGYVFSDCTSLASITIPDSVMSIDYFAFDNCTSLENIEVDAKNSVYSSFGGVLFNKEQTELIRYPAGKSNTSYTIPESVTNIGRYAFCDCTSLTSIKIPDSITSIGEDAFHYFTSLEDITIPDSVTSIGDSVFSGCTSLTSVAIPDSVTSIGTWAFSDCTSLIEITIPKSVTGIDEAVFSGCTSLTSITIPESVTSIGKWAFYSCTSLADITFPESVTSIGDGAFVFCTSLENIDIAAKNSVYSSVSGVLFNKEQTALICYPVGKSNTSYAVPDSVTSIGGAAFAFCTLLENITIPDSVTSIGVQAFCYCTSLASVTIPDSVTEIGKYAFEECHALTICGYSGSCAETYAKENSVDFCLMGDTDGNGAYETNDYAMLKAQVFCQPIDSAAPREVGDISLDGAVDAIDVIQLDLYLNGVTDIHGNKIA